MAGSIYNKNSPVLDKFKWKLLDPYSIADIKIHLKLTMTTAAGVVTEFKTYRKDLFVRCRPASTTISVPGPSEFNYA